MKSSSPTLARALWLGAVLLGLLFAETSSVASPCGGGNFDLRIQKYQRPALDESQLLAEARLRSRDSHVQIVLDPVLSSPEDVYSRKGFLSEPALLVDPVTPIKAFLDEYSDLFGYDSSILDKAKKTAEDVSSNSGMLTFIWNQDLDGIPLFEAQFVGYVTANGELISLWTKFLADPSKAVATFIPVSPLVAPEQAVAISARNIAEDVMDCEVIPVGAAQEGPERRQRFHAPVLFDEAEASLVWLPMSRFSMRLAWSIVLGGRSTGDLFNIIVDAETGLALVRHCWSSSSLLPAAAPASLDSSDRSLTCLAIRKTERSVAVFWPIAATNLTVEAAPALKGPWARVLTLPSVQNNRLEIVEEIAGPQKFYRLRANP